MGRRLVFDDRSISEPQLVEPSFGAM